jgi:hypothetical protein
LIAVQRLGITVLSALIVGILAAATMLALIAPEFFFELGRPRFEFGRVAFALAQAASVLPVSLAGGLGFLVGGVIGFFVPFK